MSKIAILKDMDSAASALLKLVTGSIIPRAEGDRPELSGPDIRTQVAIFNSVANYLAARQRVQPDEEGGLGDIISQFNSGKAKRRRGRPSGAEATAGDEPN